ncbi:migration and invasion inhibitory protein isoform X2 [Gouania willdenowi]|uniref:migration and invasion inhibitory protein isoform X2 n=1 Tax=Gouania willdenowi TaxID=441366 RepID=UPI00105421E5|nr:migration and invasion-inhibitory protein isoform X2 [Gouania willdenowi]
MFTDEVEVLRERNRELLTQLKIQRETLERLKSSSQSRRRKREDEAQEERASARAAPRKPTVRFADLCEIQAGDQQLVSTSSKHKVDSLTKPLDISSKDPEDQNNPVCLKSCLVDHSKKQSDVHPEECEVQHDSPPAERHHLQPLLGYDWIAVLDNDDTLMQRSDQFFNDLCVFRSLNKDECVHSTDSEFSEEILPSSRLLKEIFDVQNTTDSHIVHQCTFSYRINSRLFPVPLHSQECCPVCKKHKSSHPHTTDEPALVRVSVPRTILLPPYKYKAHRRCSFNPSDSLGLPSHCLSGWSNPGQSNTLPPSSLDLRSSLKVNASPVINKELEDLSSQKASSNLEVMSNVKRLAPHNFLHYFPKRKRRSMSQPLS